MDYKYLIQGNYGDGWFTIHSFTHSKEYYIKEQKSHHPNWDIRVIPNPKFKPFCKKCNNNGFIIPTDRVVLKCDCDTGVG